MAVQGELGPEDAKSVLFVPEPKIHPVRYTWLLQYTYNFTAIPTTIDKLRKGVAAVAEHLQAGKETLPIDFMNDNQLATLVATVNTLLSQLDFYQQAFDQVTNRPSLKPEKRRKRGWFNLIGRGAKKAFGLATEGDVNALKRAIRRQAQNTQEMVDSLDQIATAVNISRRYITQNRRTIKTLMKDIDLMFSNVDADLKVLRRQSFRHRYLSHVASQIGKMHTLITTFGAHFDHFRTVINTMAMGRIPVDAFPPEQLIETMTAIQDELPTGRALAVDPRNDTDSYYRFSAASLFSGATLSIFLPIPVVESADALQVFRIVNLPILSPTRKTVLRYNMDSTHIVVNSLKTKGNIISSEQFLSCLDKHCHLSVPLIPLHLASECALQLFARREESRPRTRQCTMSTRKVDEDYAHAELLTSTYKSAIWAYTATEKLPLTITCTLPNDTVTKSMFYPAEGLPLSYIDLRRGCAASNQLIEIPATEFDHIHKYHDLFEFRYNYSISFKDTDFGIWHHVANATRNMSIDWSKLGDVEKVSVDQLVYRLHDIADTDEVDWYLSQPVQIGVPSAGTLVMIAIICFIVYWCRRRDTGVGGQQGQLPSVVHHQIPTTAPAPSPGERLREAEKLLAAQVARLSSLPRKAFSDS